MINALEYGRHKEEAGISLYANQLLRIGDLGSLVLIYCQVTATGFRRGMACGNIDG